LKNKKRLVSWVQLVQFFLLYIAKPWLVHFMLKYWFSAMYCIIINKLFLVTSWNFYVKDNFCLS
jgi:hypothetical protein